MKQVRLMLAYLIILAAGLLVLALVGTAVYLLFAAIPFAGRMVLGVMLSGITMGFALVWAVQEIDPGE